MPSPRSPEDLAFARKHAWPKCDFDDCDDFDANEGKSAAFANAVVPLISPGMETPYEWVISCKTCVHVWQSANPDLQPLWLTRKSNVA